MNVLALDPASLCGFAHSSGLSGVWDLRIPGHEGKRLLLLHKRILEIHAQRGPLELIAAEDAAFGSRGQFGTQLFHAELRGVIKGTAAEIGVPFRLFKPASVKLFATGNGRAKKDQMIQACKTLLGKTPRDDNESDALWILEMCCANYETKKQIERRVKRQRSKAPKLF